MPRMSLPAAALTALLAAWSAQHAQADDASTSKSSQPSTTQKLLAPLNKLKQFTTRSSGKADSVGKESSGPNASKPGAKQVSHTEANVKSRTAAYNDDQDSGPGEELPAPPRPTLKAPGADIGQAAPARTDIAQALPPGPAHPKPLPPTPAARVPAFAPLPGHRNDPGYAIVPGYPYTHAPLNPCPVPNVPYQVGSTIVTNQALYPQEMLYPHKYRAMYPPFYYKVRGHWVVTPFGVWSNDHWELQGTEVKVNYRSHYNPVSLFHPPHLK